MRMTLSIANTRTSNDWLFMKASPILCALSKMRPPGAEGYGFPYPTRPVRNLPSTGFGQSHPLALQRSQRGRRKPSPTNRVCLLRSLLVALGREQLRGVTDYGGRDGCAVRQYGCCEDEAELSHVVVKCDIGRSRKELGARVVEDVKT